MQLFDKVRPVDLERRELQLTLFTCLAIGVLAVGTAVLMYPVVFSHQNSSPDRTLRIAFFGFCALCLLLAVYLYDRQRTIRGLRSQMAEDRRRVAEAQQEASLQLLKTMPNFSSFQDRLPMEYRRTTATAKQLSIVVVSIQLPATLHDPMAETNLLGDAAKVVSRKLREMDSIYILGPACFGAVLPGMAIEDAQRVSDRIAEGLGDAAGAANRFSYKTKIVNYPANASSAHELLESVCALMPGDNSIRGIAEEALR